MHRHVLPGDTQGDRAELRAELHRCQRRRGLYMVHLRKLPMTAVDLLHDHAFPAYDAESVALNRILLDNGHDCCSRPLHHPLEHNCPDQHIQHRTTKVGSPETNGRVERFHSTLKDGFISLANRRKHYASIEALQTALNAYVAFCDGIRAHHGYRTRCRTAKHTLADYPGHEEVNPIAA